MRSKSRPRPDYAPGFPKKIVPYSELMPDKFWDAIEVDYTSGCWNWEQATMRFREKGQSRPIRPWVSTVFLGYEASFSKCGNAKCANPAHLCTEYHSEEQARITDDYEFRMMPYGRNYRGNK